MLRNRPKTKILVDGGDPNETLRIKILLGFVDGQTTNPSLIAKNPDIQQLIESGHTLSPEEEKNEYKKIVQNISPLVGDAGVSIEVFADLNTKAEEMLAQGQEMFSWIPNAYVKYPCTHEGLRAAQMSVQKGIRVNMAQARSSAGSNTQEINAQNANNVCGVYFSMPKPGVSQQYEAGRKKHMQFHRDQKDTWTWNTFAIETGDNAGMYVTSSCGHAWKDFDEWESRMGKADTADGATNLTPYVQSGRNGFYVYRSDMSLAPANQPAAPMTAVTIFVLHPGAGPDFIAAIKKVNDALGKQSDWPKTGGWLQLVNGGEGPTFVLLNSRKNWADFAPLPKTVADVLNDTYGKETADQIQKTIRDCTAHQYTEAAAYRADLSYVPGK